MIGRQCFMLRTSGNPHLAFAVGLLWRRSVWIFAVWWLVSHRIDRFLLAGVAACGGDCGWLRRCSEERWWRWTVYGVVVGRAWRTACWRPASTLVGDNRWFVSLEQLRRDRPWPQHTPQRVKASHQWLNENVQPGQAVLLVGDAEPFDLEMPVFYNTCFDDCLLCDWMLNKSAERAPRSTGQSRHRLGAWSIGRRSPGTSRRATTALIRGSSRNCSTNWCSRACWMPPVPLGEGYEDAADRDLPRPGCRSETRIAGRGSIEILPGERVPTHTSPRSWPDVRRSLRLTNRVP